MDSLQIQHGIRTIVNRLMDWVGGKAWRWCNVVAGQLHFMIACRIIQLTPKLVIQFEGEGDKEGEVDKEPYSF